MRLTELSRSLTIRILLGGILLFLASPARGGKIPVKNPGADDIVPGVVIIKFSAAKAVGPKFRLFQSQRGLLSLEPLFPHLQNKALRKSAADDGLARIFSARIPAGADPVSTAQSLSRLDGIEYAEPRYVQHPSAVPNDPGIPSQTSYLNLMHVFDAWSLVKGDSASVIAIVDGGTMWDHEDLLANLRVNPAEDINHNKRFDPGPPSAGGDENGIDDDGDGKVDDVLGWNFATNTNDPRGFNATPGSYAHGTATASCASGVADNGVGIAGTSWNCPFFAVCIASPTTDGVFLYGYEGIEYAFRAGAKIINCSWGRLGPPSRFEQDVIDAADAAGAVVVVAAGNNAVDSDALPSYPACYHNLLAVGATNSDNDGLTLFSNYGLGIGVYAPGVSIYIAVAGGGYFSGSGTSFSSPMVAGLAALLHGVHPTWLPAQIRAQIRASADFVDNATPTLAGHLGHGRVNFQRALTLATPGIELKHVAMQTPAGQEYFLPGDSVVVTCTVENLLPPVASNVVFTLSTTDPKLTVLRGSSSVATLGAGETILPTFVLRVGDIAIPEDLLVRIDWQAEGGYRDAGSALVTVLPTAPRWLTAKNVAGDMLFAVRSLGNNIVWAVGGSIGFGVAILSTDGGVTWEDRGSGLEGISLYCVAPLDAQHVWAGSGGGEIYRTTNGGQNWFQQIYAGEQSPFLDAIWFVDATTGFILGDPPAGTGKFVILKTTDAGEHWAHIPGEPAGTTNEAGWANSMWWSDSRHGWIGSNKAHLWRTVDGGNTWTISGLTGAQDSYGVAFRDSLRGIVVHENNIVGHTLDGGLTFIVDPIAGATGFTGASWPASSPHAWAAETRNPYKDVSATTTWKKEGTYPFSGVIASIWMVDTTRGWAVTTGGDVLRYSPPDTPDVAIVPTTFAILQNFPNPFNPGTMIRYTIAGTDGLGLGAKAVRLAIYDILGREVTVLVDEPQIPRDYQVAWDARGLASGIYLCRLQAGDEVRMIKMVHLK